jgi:electron transport complex protein RnfA
MSELTKSLLMILVSTIFVNNFVLAKFLGICPFLGVSKKLESALGMSFAVIFVMGLASAVTWPIQIYILDPNKLAYLQTIVFILVIAALVQLVEIVLKKFIPALHRSLGVYLPLITTNCCVLGVTVLNIEESYGFLESVVNGVGAGIGFLLAMVLFAGVRSRMESCKISKAFDGIPITLIAASIVAVAFMGFSGVVDGLFGA